jgi:sugar phosphate isomerase/epimerase
MTPLKYAFMTFSTPEMTLEDNLATARKYGYRGVEIRIQAGHAHKVETGLNRKERNEVKEKFRLAEIDLCCLATSLQFSNTPDREKILDSAKEIITLASDLGTSFIRVFGGPVPAGTERERSIIETSEALSMVMEAASQANITLCFETHDDWCDPVHVKALMERVNHPNLRVNWDILHPVRRGFASVEESFNLLRPWISHVHVHDCTFDLSDPKAFAFVPMGEGMVDHKTAIECLTSMNYQGFISGEWINFEPPEVHLPREIARLKQYASES